MSIIRRDEYMLGQSIAKSLSGLSEAIRIDLTLSPNPYLHAGAISGKVKNSLGTPLPDAVVLVFDEHFNTVAHTLSDSDGSFTFSPIDPGSGYHLYAQAPGFSLGESEHFNLVSHQSIEIEIRLSPLLEQTQIVITGQVLNSHGFAIKSASIELYMLSGEKPELLSHTFSNDDGQFVFQGIEPGSYQVKANASGYYSNTMPVEIHHHAAITRVDVILNTDPKASQGVITGLITDDSGQPLAKADVILYRVGNDLSLTPVAYTKTTNEGVYLFVNVPQGEYRINSNRVAVLESF
ncbi:MAG: carboxypeptidase-like regulatory domain-containing protein [Clostridia bacterium]|nr:carboxypeptidase-like regulatory domain-containing protein [Clostridia bacterium]